MLCFFTFKSKKCQKSAKLDKKVDKKKERKCLQSQIYKDTKAFVSNSSKQTADGFSWPLCLSADLSSSAVSTIVSVIQFSVLRISLFSDRHAQHPIFCRNSHLLSHFRGVLTNNSTNCLGVFIVIKSLVCNNCIFLILNISSLVNEAKRKEFRFRSFQYNSNHGENWKVQHFS